ncbi:hypothetical protein ACP70R_008830 [Stipagrostis hirtigluma subsp. patula]
MSSAPSPSTVPVDMAAGSGISLLFLVRWLGVLYHLFPLVSFLATKDWKKVFYDCFGPQMLLADSFTIVITLWHHIFAPMIIQPIASVIVHTFGFALNFMSICMFAMYHSLSGGIERAKYWYYCVIAAFALVVLLTFMWIDMGITIEEENDARAYVGYILAAFAELYQIFWPALVRVLKKNFVNDEKPVFRLKISATTMSIVVQSCGFWHMLKQNGWSSHIEKRFMVLSLINIIGGCLQLVVRLIGVERFADPVERVRSRGNQWFAEHWAV